RRTRSAGVRVRNPNQNRQCRVQTSQRQLAQEEYSTPKKAFAPEGCRKGDRFTFHTDMSTFFYVV
ncbi:hypothetical protein AVEN_29881-2-1, partial [Araneus ventricosus]